MIIKRRVSLKATQKHHVKIWMIDFAPPSRQHLTCNNGMKHGLRMYDDYTSNRKLFEEKWLSNAKSWTRDTQ